jgi:O-antigen/teichoic acid export membrane protein
VDIVSKVLALGVVVILGRRLSGDHFGQVVSSHALAGILAALLDIGVNYRLVALVVTDRRKARHTVNRRYRLLLAIVGAALPFLAVPSVRLVAISVIAATFMSSLPTGALLASGRRNWAATALVLPNLLFLFPIAIAHALAPAVVIGIWALANLVTLLALWQGVEWLRPTRSPETGTMELVKDSGSIAFFNVVVLCYGRADTILLAVMVSAAVAGIYGTYYRLVLAAVSLTSWSGGIVASRLHEETSGEGSLRRLIRGLVLIGVLAAPVLYFFLPLAVDTLLATETEISPVGRLALALVPIPAMVVNALVYFLVIKNEQQRLIRVGVTVALAAVVIYPLFITLFGFTGAAGASVIIETFACLLFANQARRL